MKEFNVKIVTFRGYEVAAREKAIKRAKNMVLNIKEDGHPVSEQWARLEHAESGEILGWLIVENGEVVGVELDMSVATIKALLD